MKLLVLLMVISTNLFAHTTEKVNFTFFGNDGRNRIYVSCYYAENAADSILAQLNVSDVDSNCSGGINSGSLSPVYLRLVYSLPEGEQTITINSDYNSNCYFDTKLIEALVSASDRIEKVKGSSNCFNSDSSYSYTLKIK